MESIRLDLFPKLARPCVQTLCRCQAEIASVIQVNRPGVVEIGNEGFNRTKILIPSRKMAFRPSGGLAYHRVVALFNSFHAPGWGTIAGLEQPQPDVLNSRAHRHFPYLIPINAICRERGQKNLGGVQGVPVKLLAEEMGCSHRVV